MVDMAYFFVEIVYTYVGMDYPYPHRRGVMPGY